MTTMNSFVALCLSLPLAVACASAPAETARPDADRPREAPGAVGQEAGATPAATLDAFHSADGTEVAAASEQGPAQGTSSFQLATWNDPAFQRRFTESFLAETEIEPRVTLVEREQMEKVLEHMSSDELDKAVKVLEKNAGEGANAVFDFTLAHIRLQQDELELAAASYRTATEKFPKFRRAWQYLGLIHVREGEYAEALPALTRVIELGGGDATTYGALGFSYASLAKYIPAESAYRMANLLEPERMDWKMGLAESLFRQQRYGDVVALCGALIDEDPDNARLWMLQANGYLGLEQRIRAAENLEFVDRLGESTGDSLSLLGDIYVTEELFDLGVDAYVRALEKDPMAGSDRALRAAQGLAARGALAETGQLLERIEVLCGDELEDDQRKALLRLEVPIAVEAGAGDEEARLLEEIVALDPLDGKALILLGQYAARNDDPEKAVFYFERAASLEEFEADAKVAHGQLLVSQASYAAALPLLRRAQALKPRESLRAYIEQIERIAKGR